MNKKQSNYIIYKFNENDKTNLFVNKYYDYIFGKKIRKEFIDFDNYLKEYDIIKIKNKLKELKKSDSIYEESYLTLVDSIYKSLFVGFNNIDDVDNIYIIDLDSLTIKLIHISKKSYLNNENIIENFVKKHNINTNEEYYKLFFNKIDFNEIKYILI